MALHPNMPSTSVIYSEIPIGDIKMIDAAKLNDKEIVFIWNGKQMLAYAFAENPILKIRWKPDQSNFTMNITAKNEKAVSEP